MFPTCLVLLNKLEHDRFLRFPEKGASPQLKSWTNPTLLKYLGRANPLAIPNGSFTTGRSTRVFFFDLCFAEGAVQERKTNHQALLQVGPPVDSVQLVYKWLNSMVYGRYSELVNGGYNGL